jgi:hypothetical protein
VLQRASSRLKLQNLRREALQMKLFRSCLAALEPHTGDSCKAREWYSTNCRNHLCRHYTSTRWPPISSCLVGAANRRETQEANRAHRHRQTGLACLKRARKRLMHSNKLDAGQIILRRMPESAAMWQTSNERWQSRPAMTCSQPTIWRSSKVTTRLCCNCQKTSYSQRKLQVLNLYICALKSGALQKIEKLVAIIDSVGFRTGKRPRAHGLARRDVNNRATAQPQDTMDLGHIPAIGIEKIRNIHQEDFIEG